MIRTETLAYHDNGGRYHQVVQTWARIPATDVWTIVAVQEVEVDQAREPARPTRPV